jgi:hypothetical protein
MFKTTIYFDKGTVQVGYGKRKGRTSVSLILCEAKHPMPVGTDISTMDLEETGNRIYLDFISEDSIDVVEEVLGTIRLLLRELKEEEKLSDSLQSLLEENKQDLKEEETNEKSN